MGEHEWEEEILEETGGEFAFMHVRPCLIIVPIPTLVLPALLRAPCAHATAPC